MTVAEVMKLPSMVGAEVVAGRGGLGYPVESVNVLADGDFEPLFPRQHL